MDLPGSLGPRLPPRPPARPCHRPRRPRDLALLAAVLGTLLALAARGYVGSRETQAQGPRVRPDLGAGSGAWQREREEGTTPSPAPAPPPPRDESCCYWGHRRQDFILLLGVRGRRSSVREANSRCPAAGRKSPHGSPDPVREEGLRPSRDPWGLRDSGEVGAPLIGAFAPKQESARTRRKTMFFFSALDVNRDMYVSAEEFKPIAELLRVIKPLSGSEKAQEVVKEEKSSLQEKLTIVARFQPLLLDTMSNSKSGFREISDIILSGLKNWTNPALSSSVFSASQFKAFLPPRNDMELGEVWWIIPDTVLTTGVYLSDNRFYPPPPKGKEVIIHKLLSMFHTRPFVKTRFGPQGTVACLTAISGSYYTVAFRIHAEFQLNQPLHYPFWFCPSQFTGHIILSKNSSHVQDFKLFVPNERSLNVGLQWLHGPLLNPHVDLGYLPQMKLEASGPSMPSSIQDEKSNETDSCLSSKEAVQFKMEDIVWQQELSREEAAQQLERAMYDFKKVQYLPFTKAFDRARTEKKLVHSVILWGALDDQSC
ncbi:selenoprotein N-like isoform 1-T2 [Sarcophilus harrisii]